MVEHKIPDYKSKEERAKRLQKVYNETQKQLWILGKSKKKRKRV